MMNDVELLAEELCVPHMMSLSMEKLYADGYELRLDARGYLDNSMRAILRRAGPSTYLDVARKSDTFAAELMRDTDFDDAKTALLATSYFVLKLVDENLIHDKTSQAVLCALMVTSDANEDENPESHNLVKKAQDKAGKMLSRALQRGMFNHMQVKN